MIKVKYNSETTLVEGYFPDNINYPNNDIDTVNKTIDGQPYIEIEADQQVIGITMCVVDGKYQEFIPTPEVELQEAKDSRIEELASNREMLSEKSTVTYDSKTYSNSQNARIAILNFLQKLVDDTTTEPYFTYPDREIVNLDRLDFIALGNLIESNESSLRITEIGLINDINDCLTVDEVNNINIDFS